MRSFALVLLFASLGGCGLIVGVESRTKAVVDAGEDVAVIDAGGRRCKPVKPFGMPQLVPGLNTGAGEFHATFSHDEREVFITGTDGADVTIFRATRANENDPFGPRTLVDVDPTPLPRFSVALSRDDRVLYFDSGNKPRKIYRMSRAGIGQPFGPPELITFAWAKGKTEEEPFPTSLGLYFTSQTGTTYDLFSATPLDDGGFSTPTPLPVNTTMAQETSSVENPEGTILYYGNAIGTDTKVIRRARSMASGPYDSFEIINVPNGSFTYPVWVSEDDCHLYVAIFNGTGGEGGHDIWMLARPN